MIVIGIDPGPQQSGMVLFRDGAVENAGTFPNGIVRRDIRNWHGGETVIAIEQVRSYGMAVGAEVFDTCVETGRFVECAGGTAILIPRMDVKMHLCKSPRAKDANIRQALIDKLGPAGTKKAPGPTYGVSKHAWAALAVAVTAAETRIQEFQGAKAA